MPIVLITMALENESGADGRFHLNIGMIENVIDCIFDYCL